MNQKPILHDWYERASVRSKPRRLVRDQLLVAEHVCFPAQLTPFVLHPRVAAADPKIVREGLMHQLFSYLTFTDRLEHELVNKAVHSLARGPSGLQLSSEMKFDAHKICCDETYHSLFSIDLMLQIEAGSSFRFDPGCGHPSFSRFEAIIDRADSSERSWFRLFLVIVSETMITNSLLRIPRSEDVIPAVREMVADHAQDEARHHAFFSRLCKDIWPQVPRAAKVRIGVAIPELIKGFVSPDYPAVEAFLRRHFSPRQSADIIAESYPPDALLAEARKAGQATIRVFRDAGACELPEVADALGACSFLEGIL